MYRPRKNRFSPIWFFLAFLIFFWPQKILHIFKRLWIFSNLIIKIKYGLRGQSEMHNTIIKLYNSKFVVSNSKRIEQIDKRIDIRINIIRFCKTLYEKKRTVFIGLASLGSAYRPRNCSTVANVSARWSTSFDFSKSTNSRLLCVSKGGVGILKFNAHTLSIWRQNRLTAHIPNIEGSLKASG